MKHSDLIYDLSFYVKLENNKYPLLKQTSEKLFFPN